MIGVTTDLTNLALNAIAITAGVATSLFFIQIGSAEFDLSPITAGLIMLGVGLVFAFMKGVISLYGLGIIGGTVSMLIYYYMPRSTEY